MFGRRSIFAVYVTDVEEAMRWYGEKLDFAVRADHSGDSLKWATVSPPESDWMFVLVEPGLHGEELAARFQAEIGFSPHYMLSTSDLDGTLSRLRERGVEVSPPAPVGGVLQAHFKDLYGNSVTLVSDDEYDKFLG